MERGVRTRTTVSRRHVKSTFSSFLDGNQKRTCEKGVDEQIAVWGTVVCLKDRRFVTRLKQRPLFADKHETSSGVQPFCHLASLKPFHRRVGCLGICPSFAWQSSDNNTLQVLRQNILFVAVLHRQLLVRWVCITHTCLVLWVCVRKVVSMYISIFACVREKENIYFLRKERQKQIRTIPMT